VYVATNRQKKNAFAKRADMQRKAEEKAKPEPRATPTPVAGPKPDLEAMRAAAAEAAALIHTDATEPEYTAEEETAAILADPETMAAIADAEAEPKRGRKPSPAVKQRLATILQLLAENPEGLSKPQLATELQEKEANVYSSLRKLLSDGKVMVDSSGGGSYRWFLA
jgi:hypothetical protein